MSLIGGLRYLGKNLMGGGQMLKVGDPAPDFEAVDHNGNRVKLGDFRGKKLVLWFYPKADTGG
jgi:peroxiredoxin